MKLQIDKTQRVTCANFHFEDHITCVQTKVTSQQKKEKEPNTWLLKKPMASLTLFSFYLSIW